MPVYCFRCKECGFDFEGVFRMSEPKNAKCPKCKSAAERVFLMPQLNTDVTDPHNLDALVQKTGKMKGTVGDLFDFSKEMSIKRGGRNDPVRRQALEAFSKKRGGKKLRVSDD